MRGKGVRLVLRAAAHAEELELLQASLRELAVQLVVADLMREHHRQPVLVKAAIEEDEAVVPAVEVHAEQVLVVIGEFDMDAELLRERHHRVAGTRLDAPHGLIELYRIHPITSCTSSACISGCLPWPASRPSQASA